MQDRLRSVFRRFGYDVVAAQPVDLCDDVKQVDAAVRPFTMTSIERINALCEAVRYVTSAGIPGDFVECGVWRGGSSMAALSMLLRLGDFSRHMYLYDTFEGMSAPTQRDRAFSGESATRLLESTPKRTESVWCYASLEDVRRNVLAVGYPAEKISFVQGKVEETIPRTIPDRIALLRLDTDWYESTKHELRHLFPLLAPGGVLIIDDYGHWQGAREAVDEYFRETGTHILLNRIDYTGRIAVKP